MWQRYPWILKVEILKRSVRLPTNVSLAITLCVENQPDDDASIVVHCPVFTSSREFLDFMGLADQREFRDQYDKTQWPRQTERLAAIIAEKPSTHWDEVFHGSDACVAVVKSPDDSLSDPHMQARGSWQHTQGALQAAPAPRFAKDAAKINAAPIRDQNRAEILSELKPD